MPDFDPLEQEVFDRSTSRRTHPPLAVLQAHGQDVLPAEAERSVGAHLATCAMCRQLLADMATLPEPELTGFRAERVRAAIPQDATKDMRSKGYRPALAFAAMALIGVSLFGAYRLLHDDLTPKITSTTQPAVKTVAPPQMAQVEAPKMAVVEKLAPPQTLDLTTRGAHAGPTTEEMLPAFRAYNRNDLATARIGFEALHRRYPAAEIPALYLGVTSLLLNQNEAAGEALHAAQNVAHPGSAHAIAWYSAIAAQRLQQPAAAVQFAAICQSASPYAARACAIAK